MADTPNVQDKVKYGISDMHYAVMTSSGYGAVKAHPGAVSLTLSPEGENINFAADNSNEYFVVVDNRGYTGSVEVARLLDEFFVDILGETLDTVAKTLLEKADGQEAVHFAFGCKIDGPNYPTYIWFYNCTAERPNLNANTTGETTEPETDSFNIACHKDSAGKVRCKTTCNTPDAVIEGWFSSVFDPENYTPPNGSTPPSGGQG